MPLKPYFSSKGFIILSSMPDFMPTLYKMFLGKLGFDATLLGLSYQAVEACKLLFILFVIYERKLPLSPL
jgi:hypothetical protein